MISQFIIITMNDTKLIAIQIISNFAHIIMYIYKYINIYVKII